MLALAAATGIVTWRLGSGHVDLLGIIGVGGFLAAILIELSLWRRRPDKIWYDGRAIAESAKTLAWKYAVGGLPFPISMPVTEATTALLDKLRRVREQFPDVELDASTAPAISQWMKDQRAKPFDERKDLYLNSRIKDQQQWYAAKAKYNARRSEQWRGFLIGIEFLGAAVSLTTALVDTSLVIPPTIATIAGAVVAWIETKQHDSLSRAYSAASIDLASAAEKLQLAVTEDAWTNEVDDAEEAISREHVVWLATRHRL